MLGYWLRVFGAFGLLKAASRIMKDAEAVLAATHKLDVIEHPEPVAEVTGNTEMLDSIEATDGPQDETYVSGYKDGNFGG